MTSERTSRIIRTLIALQSNQNNSPEGLAKMHQCCKRTILRDLKELKNIGIEYEYDHKSNRYQLHSECSLNPPGFNSKEAIALLLLARKARNHLRIPFHNSALTAILKLESSLAPPIKKYCKDILAKITIKSAPQETTDSFDSIFLSLMKSIYRKRILHFTYCLSDTLKNVITIDPYHLYHRNHKWYLIGRSHFHQRTMHFELNRINDFNISGKCFIDNGNFNINEYIDSAWHTKPDHGLYNVKLKFSAQIAQEVAAIQWHKNQQITRHSDSSITVEFVAYSLDEITQWVLGYGDNVQVISPEVLRKNVTKIANNLMNLYATECNSVQKPYRVDPPMQ